MAVDAGPRLVCNGINGATGGYWLEGVPATDVARIALGERIDAEEQAALKERDRAATESLLGGPMEGVNPRNLAEAGWGIVFAFQADLEVKKALEPLLVLRQSQAGDLYREFIGADAVRPGETSAQFLARHGIAPGAPANPRKVPYYLLLVGAPTSISYSFQYQLDVIYAVGRIAFDTLDEYAAYARAVASAERRPPRPTTVSVFGTRNPGDPATALSADQLVAPLAATVASRFADIQVDTAIGEAATKARLGTLLGGGATPSLVFSASHGMAFPPTDNRQLQGQGALLCQDWPGPAAWEHRSIPESFYFGAADVPDDATLSGVIAFLFACYGAGTPKYDDFARQAFGRPVAIAPDAFMGRLPRRLLGHPMGGALAVVGHVERAWGYSFMWPNAGAQVEVFESTITALLNGDPVGLALEYFNDRYAALASEITSAQQEAGFGAVIDPSEIAATWTGMSDARNYIVLGDPAVRLS